MFNEYLKPVRSFYLETNIEPKEIDTHGLLALVKIMDNSVCILGAEDDITSNSFFLSPGEFFRFNGKIRVKNEGAQNGIVRIMLFEKE